MSNTHEVISAFLDDEPFDPQDLATALADPDGRALLIDVLALRTIVQPTDAMPTAGFIRPTSRFRLRPALAAAAVFLALGTGFVLGERRTATAVSQAPPPTRIVQAGTSWQAGPSGGIR
jgi:hypothetical protein